jgi:malate synthase
MILNYQILKNKEEWKVAKQTSSNVPGDAVMRVDSVPAAFELEHRLFEQKDHVTTLHCDHDGYLLSFIETFREHPEFVLPDRADMTPRTHFLHSLSQLVVSVGQRRGAAVTGDVDVSSHLHLDRIEAADLLLVPRGRITERGIRQNICTALLQTGTVAALARAQLWQWVRHETGVLDEGRIVTGELFATLLEDELAEIGSDDVPAEAAQDLAGMVLSEELSL